MVKKNAYLISFAALVLALVLINSGRSASAETVTGDTSLGGVSMYLQKAAKKTTVSGGMPLGGFSLYLSDYLKSLRENPSETVAKTLSTEEVEIPDNIAIAKVNDYLNIRSGAGTNNGVIGYMPKNSYCLIQEEKDGWAKIVTGDLEGYVSTDYLYTGLEGYLKAKELLELKAVVTASSVNFRSEPTTKPGYDNIIETVDKGERLTVLEDDIPDQDGDDTVWTKVEVDDVEGYVSKEFLKISYGWLEGVELSSAAEAGTTALRAALIIEAKKHLGLRYVWGGTSLTNGADCSGFCWAVYKACGAAGSLGGSRNSASVYAASSEGKTVTLAEAQPGDLVFYGGRRGYVDHVAMYIGNGQIIHESGRKYGCMISNINYRSVVKIKNFIDY